MVEDPDPDPYLWLVFWIRIWIRIKNPDPHQCDKLDPDSHKFTDDMPKFMEYEPIWALFFKGLSVYL